MHGRRQSHSKRKKKKTPLDIANDKIKELQIQLESYHQQLPIHEPPDLKSVHERDEAVLRAEKCEAMVQSLQTALRNYEVILPQMKREYEDQIAHMQRLHGNQLAQLEDAQDRLISKIKEKQERESLEHQIQEKETQIQEHKKKQRARKRKTTRLRKIDNLVRGKPSSA